MRKSFKDSDRTYGARRVWRDVLEEGLHCGLHRIERLMPVNGLKARPRRRGLPKDDGSGRPSPIMSSTGTSKRTDRTRSGWLTSIGASRGHVGELSTARRAKPGDGEAH